MRTREREPFYVGYLRTPRALVGFLAVLVGAAFGASVVLAVALVTVQGDWRDAGFRWGDGYQTLTGMLEVEPYPVLYLPPAAGHPRGRALPLSGEGKVGVSAKAAALHGKPVDVGGFLLRSGDREMLQVGGEVDLRPARNAAGLGSYTGPAVETVGRRVLRGEIVDAKCWLGAMRPGEGKTHKLCANLCLTGGIPPMLAVYRTDGPPELLLLADASGRAPAAVPLDDTARYVEVTGLVERRADLLVLRVEAGSVKRL